jgi:hypothetical protein
MPVPNGTRKLDLRIVDGPLEPVTLRNGRDAPCRRMSYGMMQRYNAAVADLAAPGAERQLAASVRECLTDVTDEEVDEMTLVSMVAICKYAAGQVDPLLEQLRKNAVGGPDAAASRPRRSTRTTRPNTTTPASPGATP